MKILFFPLLAVAALFLPSQSFAQDAFFTTGEGLEKIGLILEHQAFSAAGPAPGLEIQEQRAAISVPIFTSEQSTFALTARGQRTLLNRSIQFADRSVQVPKEFGTAEAGVAYTRKVTERDRVAISASVGSAGTHILNNGRTPILGANLVVDRKQESGNSWIYFLNYSNNRSLLNNIPIPGFAYAMNSPNRKIVLGLPFSFALWRPDPWLAIAVVSPFIITGEIAYRFWGPLQIFSSVGWNPRAYQNLVEGSDDRLIYNKKEAALGVRAFAGPLGSVSLGYVQEYDRRFMLGRSVSDKKSDEIEINSSGGIQLKARLSF